MSLDAAAWKLIEKTDPSVVVPLVKGFAKAGDTESLTAAMDAWMSRPKNSDERGRRLHAVLSILDQPGKSPGEDVKALLKRWMRGVPPGVRQQTLTAIIDTGEALPEACEALVKAGADPYDYTSSTSSGKLTCPVFQVFDYPEREMVMLLKVLVGDTPITNEDQLPRFLERRAGMKPEAKLNLLEYAAEQMQYETVDWLLSRIDPHSEAKNLLFALGDLALEDIESARKQTNMRSNLGPLIMPSTFGSLYTHLAAGAQFRDADTWLDVANARTYGRGGTTSETLLHALTSEADSATMAPVRMRVVKTLLANARVDINRRGSNEKTMLHEAVDKRDLSLAQLLLEHGADPARKSGECAYPLGAMTPLDRARELGLGDIIPMLEAVVAKNAISAVLDRARNRAAP